MWKGCTLSRGREGFVAQFFVCCFSMETIPAPLPGVSKGVCSGASHLVRSGELKPIGGSGPGVRGPRFGRSAGGEPLLAFESPALSDSDPGDARRHFRWTGLPVGAWRRLLQPQYTQGSEAGHEVGASASGPQRRTREAVFKWRDLPASCAFQQHGGKVCSDGGSRHRQRRPSSGRRGAVVPLASLLCELLFGVSSFPPLEPAL